MALAARSPCVPNLAYKQLAVTAHRIFAQFVLYAALGSALLTRTLPAVQAEG